MIHETNLPEPTRKSRLGAVAALTGTTALVLGISLLLRDRPSAPVNPTLVEMVETDSSAFVASDREEFVRTVEVQLDRLHRLVDEVAPVADSEDVEALRGLHTEIAVRLLDLRGETPANWTEVRDDVLEDLEEMSSDTLELVEEVS